MGVFRDRFPAKRLYSLYQLRKFVVALIITKTTFPKVPRFWGAKKCWRNRNNNNKHPNTFRPFKCTVILAPFNELSFTMVPRDRIEFPKLWHSVGVTKSCFLFPLISSAVLGRDQMSPVYCGLYFIRQFITTINVHRQQGNQVFRLAPVIVNDFLFAIMFIKNLSV